MFDFEFELIKMLIEMVLVENLMEVGVEKILKLFILGKSKTFELVDGQDSFLQEKLANGIDFRLNFIQFQFYLKDLFQGKWHILIREYELILSPAINDMIKLDQGVAQLLEFEYFLKLDVVFIWGFVFYLQFQLDYVLEGGQGMRRKTEWISLSEGGECCIGFVHFGGREVSKLMRLNL